MIRDHVRTIHRRITEVTGKGDAIIAVDLEYQQPDKTARFPGGFSILGHEVEAVIEFNDNGDECGRFTPQQLEDRDALTCDTILANIAKWVESNNDWLCEQARQEAQSETDWY